ncbi:MAG TPA: Hsp20/alpha crystallin family protein [Acidimicrobiia bacterium]|nr:Hsp20/alpha crystallin family protein [Acidimicrobiia bacterium]
MLVRYDPFDACDQFLEGVLENKAPRRIPIDAVRRGGAVEMSCELPGAEPGSIDVRVDGDVLAIRAERAFAAASDDEVLELERAQGPFARDVALGADLDGGQVATHFEGGVLRITIPLVDAVAA